MREIKIGHLYHHFKGKNYIVVDIVNDCESSDGNLKKIVIYQALYDNCEKWARSLESFASEVDREKYPDVDQKWRFEEIKL